MCEMWRPGGGNADHFCPDHGGMWTIVVLTFEIVRQSYHFIFGPPVVGTVESLVFSAEPIVGTVEYFVEDAARLEQTSGALSASVARLAPAGRSLPPSSSHVEMHPTAVLDQSLIKTS